MEGSPETRDELPRVNWADYINRMEIIDMHGERQRSRDREIITEEAYGMIDGWGEDTHCYIHEITTSRIGIKLQTKAAFDEIVSPQKILNKPDAVEFYTTWLSFARNCDKIYINTTDPQLAREIHLSFFEVLMQSDSVAQAFEWLSKQSRYAQMKSQQDSTIPLIDFMPPSARKMARDYSNKF